MDSTTKGLLEGEENLEINRTPGELEPTTKTERVSWYLYEFAMQVVNSGCLVFTMPLLLDYLAFQSGSGYPAPILKPGDSASMLPDFNKLYATNSSWYVTGSCVDGDSANFTIQDQGYYARCVVPWGTGYVRHTTWALNVISVSVGIQAFCFISLSSLADHGDARKKYLYVFTIIGCIACVLHLIPFNISMYWLAGVFAVILNVAIGVAGVFYNAFLPLLVLADPQILNLTREEREDMTIFQKKTEKVNSHISTHGFALGYLSGTLFAAVCGATTLFIGRPYGLQVGTALCGVWWAAIPYLIYGKARPGPPLPAGETHLFYSWKLVWKTILAIPKIPNTFWFLLAYYLFSDGYSTITNVAVLFAQSELKASNLDLAALIVIVPFIGAIGSYIFLSVQNRLGTSSKSCLIAILVIYTIMCLYGLLGLSPSLPIGFKKINVINGVSWELYLFAFIHGFVLCPAHIYSRTVFAEIIPPGREAEFFGFFEITNKGSSWMGPLIVAIINDSGGTLRLSFIYLVLAFAIPIPILIFLVNMVQGKIDAINIAKKELEMKEKD